MKKKSLIVFVLAAFSVAISWFHSVAKSCPAHSPTASRLTCFESRGWPFVFWDGLYPASSYSNLVKGLQTRELLLEFLFWFLVIFGVWLVVKWVKEKHGKNK